MASQLISDISKLITGDVHDAARTFLKMSLKDMDAVTDSNSLLQPLWQLEELIGSLHAQFAIKKKGNPCTVCHKKIVNMKLHIQNMHTCEYCKSVTIPDLSIHRTNCTVYIDGRIEAAEKLGLIYIHAVDEDFKVKDGNVYEYDKITSMVGNYIGQLKEDPIDWIDYDAKECLPKGKTPVSCTFCEKKLINLKAHIENMHTCYGCNIPFKELGKHKDTCDLYKEKMAKICERFDAAPKEQPQKEAAPKEQPQKEAAPKEQPQKEAAPKEQPQKEAADDSTGTKKKKEKIPAHIKTIVWAKFIGSSIPEAKCYCCKHERIEIRSFECGHVIAEAKGGELIVDNLRPICKGCNGAMGTMSMDEYSKKFFGRSVLEGNTVVTGDLDLFSLPITAKPVININVDPFADLLQF